MLLSAALRAEPEFEEPVVSHDVDANEGLECEYRSLRRFHGCCRLFTRASLRMLELLADEDIRGGVPLEAAALLILFLSLVMHNGTSHFNHTNALSTLLGQRLVFIHTFENAPLCVSAAKSKP